MDMRVGHGYDVHRFADNETADGLLTLGGVRIPYQRVLLAHSDGDVIVHALCDAILGAIGAGDIGHHFPDTDAQYENADSLELLARVMELAGNDGWQLGNADMTVVAQAPRLATHIPAMREKLAQVLRVDPACVNVKATTTEGLGFAGRKEGIAAHAVVLVTRSGASAGQQ